MRYLAAGRAAAQQSCAFATLVEDAFGIPPERQVRRVVVTGLGLVSPLGIGLQHVWERLLRGDCGIKRLTEDDLPKEHRAALGKLPSKVAAMVPGREYADALRSAGMSEKGPRFVNFAELAALEALKDAEWEPVSMEEREATGVAMGSGLSCTTELAQAGTYVIQGLVRKISPFLVTRILANSPAGAVSIRHGFHGPNLAPATACAAGADAIGDAFRLIRAGDADVMVAGGTEACVDGVALAAFGRMNALCARHNEEPARASRPFDEGRCGFVLGEGAGALVLEELAHAIARGAPRIYAELRGYGMSADAHHITAPPPDGAGAARAMRAALRDGGVAPADVAHVNAHGTGTPLGDAAELRAIASVFGPAAADVDADTDDGGAQAPEERQQQEGIPGTRGVGRILKAVEHLLHLDERGGGSGQNRPRGPLPAISSTKGATGHLLGAAGAVEAVFAVMSLVHNTAPPTLNLEDPLPGPWAGSLVRGGPLLLPPGPKQVLSNSFGFGGVNASLLFGSPPILLDPVVDGTP